MSKEDPKLEKYKLALGLLTFEAQFLWTIFSTFLLVHAIFLGFIVQTAFKENSFFNYNLPCFLAGIVGIILVMPWYGTFRRNSDFYILRMAQSRESEPEDWNLVAGVGQKFADGQKVTVDGKEYRINLWGRILRNKISVPLLIIIFTLVYISIIISSGPWNKTTVNDKIKSSQEISNCH